MANTKRRRKQPAKRRTLPPDLPSLISMFLAVDREIRQKVVHLKREPHAYNDRRGLEKLLNQRSSCFESIEKLDSAAASKLLSDFNLRKSQPNESQPEAA